MEEVRQGGGEEKKRTEGGERKGFTVGETNVKGKRGGWRDGHVGGKRSDMVRREMVSARRVKKKLDRDDLLLPPLTQIMWYFVTIKWRGGVASQTVVK